MPGAEVCGVKNMWYSFDYGLAHFISFDGETDYVSTSQYSQIATLTYCGPIRLQSPSKTTSQSTRMPVLSPSKTRLSLTPVLLDLIAGGAGGVFNNSNYEQYLWLANDLAKVDRNKAPW
jgi:hypothetical protein